MERRAVPVRMKKRVTEFLNKQVETNIIYEQMTRFFDDKQWVFKRSKFLKI